MGERTRAGGTWLVMVKMGGVGGYGWEETYEIPAGGLVTGAHLVVGGEDEKDFWLRSHDCYCFWCLYGEISKASIFNCLKWCDVIVLKKRGKEILYIK